MTTTRVVVVLDHTLMRWDAGLGVHVSSGALPKTWFFEVPSDWTAPDGPEQMEALLNQIFTDANARLHQAEPSDPNYLAVTGFRMDILSPEQELGRPWMGAQPVWEPAVCWIAGGDRRYKPIGPGDFTILVLLRQAEAGLLDRQAFVDKGIALRGLAPEAAGAIYDRRDHYVMLLTG
jgi:hypothetical protein